MKDEPSNNDQVPQMLSLTQEKFMRLKKHYAAAVNRNAESFKFDGNLFLTGYAKYLIEYLEPKIK
jgi:hypothetical protein